MVTTFAQHAATRRQGRALRRLLGLAGLGTAVAVAWQPVAHLAEAIATLGGAL